MALSRSKWQYFDSFLRTWRWHTWGVVDTEAYGVAPPKFQLDVPCRVYREPSCVDLEDCKKRPQKEAKVGIKAPGEGGGGGGGGATPGGGGGGGWGGRGRGDGLKWG